MTVRTPALPVPLPAALAALALAAACAPPSPQPAPPARTTPAGVEWEYVVRANAGWMLEVSARFDRFAGNLTVESGAAAFVDDVRVDGRSVPGGDAEWPVVCAGGCLVQYRFRLADAARALRDLDLALEAGGAVFAPPATWLLRPAWQVRSEGRYRFRVVTPPGMDFVTGVRPSAAGSAFEGPIASFEESSFAGFGSLSPVPLGDSGVKLAVSPRISPDRAVLRRWAERQASAVDGFLGRAGDGHAVVFVVPGDDDGTSGKTLGGGGASAFIQLRQPIEERKLYEDWVLAHELIHARFPALQRRHAWFSEGLATYVEPIARVQAGLLDERKHWRDVMQGVPNGLPRRAGDQGLDGNHEWGRVYWGGALYFLVADVHLRRITGGKHSVQSALRAVIAEGGNAENSWPLERVLAVADESTGVSVLLALYHHMGLRPGTVNLEGLWKDLGIAAEGDGVRFDDTAPGAAIRRAITRAPEAAPRSEPGLDPSASFPKSEK